MVAQHRVDCNIISKDEVLAWKAEAQRTLERAQQLSSRANDSLQKASQLLNKQLLAKVNEATAQIDAAKLKNNQIQALVEDVKRNTTEYIQKYRQSIDKELMPELTRLDQVLNLLKQVEVPEFIILSEKRAVHHLSDFVSWEELDLLRANISIHRENCTKFFLLLLEKTTELGKKLHSGSVKHANTVKLYDSQVAEVTLLMNEAVNGTPPKNRSNLIHNILKENHSLEIELASVLKMLTNHYDQCCVAAHWDTIADKEDLQVLRKDSLELSSVLREMKAIQDIIENNYARADQFVEQRMPAINQVLYHCQKWMQWCTTFTNQEIMECLLLFLKCKEITLRSSFDNIGKNEDELENKVNIMARYPRRSPVHEYTEVVQQLCHHYEQFKMVYEAEYLAELHHEQFEYPRQFLEHLDDYLNVKLFNFGQEERERRRAWLEKYGEFIPRQFYLPGETNQPQVVQVLSDGLEKMESDTSKENERLILNLIKTFRVK